MQTKSYLAVKANVAWQKHRGFTLIEVIIGIVVLSISLAIFTNLIYPLSEQSAKQVHQIRAAELGQSMINEILAKAFDENSDMSGGLKRCGELGEKACTPSNALTFEPGETRSTFDDVDDYNNLRVIESSLAEGLGDIYLGYGLQVTVINDSDYDGVSDTNNYTAKLITVTVTTPQSFNFVFAVYRVNF